MMSQSSRIYILVVPLFSLMEILVSTRQSYIGGAIADDLSYSRQ